MSYGLTYIIFSLLIAACEGKKHQAIYIRQRNVSVLGPKRFPWNVIWVIASQLQDAKNALSWEYPPISCETHMPRAVGAIFPHFIPLDVEHPTLLLWLGLGRPPYPLLVRIPHDIQFVPCQPGECSAAGEPFWAQIFRPVLQFGGQRWWF